MVTIKNRKRIRLFFIILTLKNTKKNKKMQPFWNQKMPIRFERAKIIKTWLLK